MPSELLALPRPRVVDVSLWLWLGACLVGMITAAVTLSYFGQLQATVLAIVEQRYPQETPTTRENVAIATVAILIGAEVVLVLAQMALAVAMHTGRGWARFLLILLILLGGLYGAAVSGAAPTVSRTGLLATTALMVIATVPMFLPGARTWFVQRRLARSGGYTYSK